MCGEKKCVGVSQPSIHSIFKARGATQPASFLASVIWVGKQKLGNKTGWAETETEEPDLKEQTVIRELKIEELKAENELIEDEREELEDALEDLEGLDEISTSATDGLSKDEASKQAEKEISYYWRLKHYERWLHDDFVSWKFL